MEKKSRFYNFSSSKIGALCSNGSKAGSFGKPFYTYVRKKIQENKLKRPITANVSARSLSWGNHLEQFAFQKLPLEFQLVSKHRYKHISLAWSGAPDIITEVKVGDIKCPYTLQAFCDTVDALDNAEDVGKALKELNPEYYYQLISNAKLSKRTRCVFVVYMPYEEDLEEIKDACTEYDIDVQNDYYWIYISSNDKLPYLRKEGMYKDINIYEFDAPKGEIEFLESRVIIADQMLKNSLNKSLNNNSK